MNDIDILFASLMGGKITKMLPRFEQVENELAKHVLPVIPFLPLKNKVKVNKEEPLISYPDWDADSSILESRQFFPLKLSIDGKDPFTLPYEPMISITGKNNIVTRSVAKYNSDLNTRNSGTIKERWSQDDYDITITGYLVGSFQTGNMEDCYPLKDFRRLRDILLSESKIKVECQPLSLLGIDYIVVTEFNFPFSKGENIQAYEIKALSDFSYNLLIEKK